MSKSSVPSTEEMDGAISPLPVAKGGSLHQHAAFGAQTLQLKADDGSHLTIKHLLPVRLVLHVLPPVTNVTQLLVL